MSALSRPELGYKWRSQGDRIHMAGIWGQGAPVGATLSPTPVPHLLCSWDLRLDSQRKRRAHLGPTVTDKTDGHTGLAHVGRGAPCNLAKQCAR